VDLAHHLLVRTVVRVLVVPLVFGDGLPAGGRHVDGRLVNRRGRTHRRLVAHLGGTDHDLVADDLGLVAVQTL
jgi:hypothetical protein